MKNYTEEKYNNALRATNFPDYSEYDDVDQAYENFVDKITKVIDQIASMKKIRVKGNTQKWFDDEIREAIKSRDKLFKNFQKKLEIIMIIKNIREHVIMYNA